MQSCFCLRVTSQLAAVLSLHGFVFFIFGGGTSFPPCFPGSPVTLGPLPHVHSLCSLTLNILVLCAGWSSSNRLAGFSTVSVQLYFSTVPPWLERTVGRSQHLSNLKAGNLGKGKERKRWDDWNEGLAGPKLRRHTGLTAQSACVDRPAGG